MGKFLRSISTKKVTITLDLNTLNTAARSLVGLLGERGFRIDVPTARDIVIQILKKVAKPAQKE